MSSEESSEEEYHLKEELDDSVIKKDKTHKGHKSHHIGKRDQTGNINTNTETKFKKAPAGKKGAKHHKIHKVHKDHKKIKKAKHGGDPKTKSKKSGKKTSKKTSKRTKTTKKIRRTKKRSKKI